jgi:hypothetical protein
MRGAATASSAAMLRCHSSEPGGPPALLSAKSRRIMALPQTSELEFHSCRHCFQTETMLLPLQQRPRQHQVCTGRR